MDDELRKQIHDEIAKCAISYAKYGGGGQYFYDYTDAIMLLIKQDREAGTRLQPFEVYDYKRLMALESRGIDEYRNMRAAPVLTAEAVVSFINQLSPWNLATTGINVLNAYVEKQLNCPTNSEADQSGLVDFVQDPKNIAKAAEGSLKKRSELLDGSEADHE